MFVMSKVNDVVTLLVKRLVFLIGLMSAQANASIEFTSGSIDLDVVIKANQSSPLPIDPFTVNIETSGNRKAGFGLRLYSGFLTNIENPWQIINSPVSFDIYGSQNQNDKHEYNDTFSIIKGQWFNTIKPDNPSVRFYKAEFSLSVKPQALFDFLDDADRGEFIFYIIAQDVENYRYYDYQKVVINIRKEQQIQISGLQDVVFNATNKTGTLTESFDACVYSSANSFEIAEVFGTCNSDDQFLLGPSGTCSGNDDSRAIAYKLIINGEEFNGDGRGEAEHPASSQLNCGGSTNTRIDIEIEESAYSDKSAGVYTDTMTITVAPK